MGSYEDIIDKESNHIIQTLIREISKQGRMQISIGYNGTNGEIIIFSIAKE